MIRTPGTFALAVLVCIATAAGAASPPRPTDPDVAKGIKLVEDSDYDQAIWTLDRAARGLAADPAKAADLSIAYLYLGIAYVGKGHEAAAKAKFRDAILNGKDLTLSAEQFPPKVINLFEAARDEASKAPPRSGSGGSTKLILIGGGAVAAGGAVALLAGGGGDGASDARATDTLSGSVCGPLFERERGGCQSYANFDIVVSKPGTLDATVTWSDPGVLIGILLRDQNYVDVATSTRTTNTSSTLSVAVTPQTACPTCAYHLVVARSDAGGPVPFMLTVRRP